MQNLASILTSRKWLSTVVAAAIVSLWSDRRHIERKYLDDNDLQGD